MKARTRRAARGLPDLFFVGECKLPQSKPNGFDSSLWEGASGAPANFAL